MGRALIRFCSPVISRPSPPFFAISQLNDKEKLGAKISEEDKKTIEEAINDKIAWLEANQGAEADEFKAKKKEVGFNLLSYIWFLTSSFSRP